MPPGLEAHDLLGRGAMGRVYKAWQPKLQRFVAVKTCVVTEAEEHGMDPERLEDEALVIARLSHPNIVTLFDVYRDDQAIYLIMQFLDGLPLSRLISRKTTVEELGTLADVVEPVAPQIGEGRRRLTGAILREVGVSVGQALDYAHNRGVLHRDVKPANIHLTWDKHVKLLDFSIARSADGKRSSKTATGMIFGTMDYISPEQVLTQPLDGRADIYSLGGTLYHLGTGIPPFRDENDIALCMKHINDEPEDPRVYNPDMDPDMAAAILKCLEKRPEHRFQTAAELAEAMRAVGERRNSSASLSAPLTPLPDDEDGWDHSPIPPLAPDDRDSRSSDGALTQGFRQEQVYLDPVFLGCGPAEQLTPEPFLRPLPSAAPGAGTAARDSNGNGNAARESTPAAPAKKLPSSAGEEPSGKPSRDKKRRRGLADLIAESDSQVIPLSREATVVIPAAAIAAPPATPASSPAVPAAAAPTAPPPKTTPLPLPTPRAASTLDLRKPALSAEESTPHLERFLPPQPQKARRRGGFWVVLGVVVALGLIVGAIIFLALNYQRPEPPVVAPVNNPAQNPDPAVPSDSYMPEPVAAEVLPDYRNPVALPLQGTDALNLMYLPAGRFVMGSPLQEPGHDSNEWPRTLVQFQRGFYISTHEITRAQWNAVMTDQPVQGDGNLPVTGITWEEARQFCQRLTTLIAQDAIRALPHLEQGATFDLPTEAQWEYAARAGRDAAFTYGPILTSALANIDGTVAFPRARPSLSRGSLLPVGQLPPNPWGLYDMHGNAWELTLDDYFSSLPGEESFDPFRRRSNGSSNRVMRGGSFRSGAADARSANREVVRSTVEKSDLGFRVVLSP